MIPVHLVDVDAVRRWNGSVHDQVVRQVVCVAYVVVEALGHVVDVEGDAGWEGETGLDGGGRVEARLDAALDVERGSRYSDHVRLAYVRV